MTARSVASGSLGLGVLPVVLLTVLVGCAKPKPTGPAPLASSAPLPACEQESSPVARDACYFREAEKTAQAGLCLQLQSAEKKARCLIETGDGLAACQQASTIAPVPECFRKVASSTQDATVCNFIKSSYERGSCIATIAYSGDKAALCASVPRTLQQDECWQSVAQHKNDPKLCDSIKNVHRRDNCRLTTATRQDALPGGCALIENSALRDECWIQLANKDGAADDLCEHVTARKNGCYQAMARRKGPALCERVGAGPESTARRLCYEDVFGNGGPRAVADLCGSVTDIVLKQECTRARAEATHDVGLCEGIALPEIADDCFDAVASKTPEACLRIKDPGRQRQCASSHWSSSRDPRMCAPLLPKTRRDCSERMANRH